MEKFRGANKIVKKAIGLTTLVTLVTSTLGGCNGSNPNTPENKDGKNPIEQILNGDSVDQKTLDMAEKIRNLSEEDENALYPTSEAENKSSYTVGSFEFAYFEQFNKGVPVALFELNESELKRFFTLLSEKGVLTQQITLDVKVGDNTEKSAMQKVFDLLDAVAKSKDDHAPKLFFHISDVDTKAFVNLCELYDNDSIPVQNGESFFFQFAKNNGEFGQAFKIKTDYCQYSGISGGENCTGGNKKEISDKVYAALTENEAGSHYKGEVILSDFSKEGFPHERDYLAVFGKDDESSLGLSYKKDAFAAMKLSFRVIEEEAGHVKKFSFQTVFPSQEMDPNASQFGASEVEMNSEFRRSMGLEPVSEEVTVEQSKPWKFTFMNGTLADDIDKLKVFGLGPVINFQGKEGWLKRRVTDLYVTD